MLQIILIVIILIGSFIYFNGCIGWIVGLVARNKTSGELQIAGMGITLIFMLMLIGQCTSSVFKSHKLQEEYSKQYDLYHHGPINDPSAVVKAAMDMDREDDRVYDSMTTLLKNYFILVFIGMIGRMIYPLSNYDKQYTNDRV